ncbi:MAG: PaREP1 family protein [Candidatus Njordarchaeota archaeon]
MNTADLIIQAKNDLDLSFQLLEKGDIRDAAEKAWRSIENIRKALLVTIKIPYNIAKTITTGVPLFSKILRALGKRDMLRMYFYFDSRLHTLGFYEMVIPEEELEDIIRNEVPQWIEKMIEVIDSTKRIDLSRLVGLIEKMNRIRMEILRKSNEYLKISNQISKEIAATIEAK